MTGIQQEIDGQFLEKVLLIQEGSLSLTLILRKRVEFGRVSSGERFQSTHVKFLSRQLPF